MSIPNFASGTVWTGDNLNILRGMNSECVDLIYLDPPFNSNRTYEAPIGSRAAGAAFKDAWTLDDVDVHEHGELADRNPAAYAVIEAAREAHGKGMMAYSIMMAVRLLEMRRILKPTGSIYLHCDPTASHYLKLLMDSIFAGGQFRSEIVWKRTGSHGGASRWGPIHDTILYYAGKDCTWNRCFQPYDQDYLDRYYRHEDARGRYQIVSLTGPGRRPGESGAPWRGVDPTAIGRHWAIPRQSLKFAFPERDDLDSLSTQERLDMLDQAGLIYWPPRGNVPRQKRYMDENPGAPIQDVVTDIRPLSHTSKEKTDYPTQKPLALLDRIIRASSNPDDLVLDPFCGCATALVAADRLQRRWAGIDLSPLAIKLVNKRIASDRGNMPWGGATALDAPPMRTDLGELPNYRTHRHRLYGTQEGICAGCEIHFPFPVMEVDHILPRSRGGTDHADNLQLLCSGCNRSKGGRTMAEWRASQ